MNQAKEPIPKISLEVMGGIDDGLFFHGNKPDVYIGRERIVPNHPSNDLPLKDTYSSRTHSQVSHRDGHWYLSDRGSQNSTRVHEQVLKKDSTGAKLNDRDFFLAGFPVLEFRMPPRERPAGPAGKLPPLTGAARKMLDRARQIALDNSHNFVSVEDLFVAIADSKALMIPDFFDTAKLDPADVARQVKAYERWKGKLAWIDKASPPVKINAARLSKKHLILTPRLRFVMRLAEGARGRSGSAGMEAVHLLIGILEENGSVPAMVLAEMGQDCPKLATMLLRLLTARVSQVADEEATEPDVTRTHIPDAEALAELMAKKKPKRKKRKPVDHASWLEARELLEDLLKIQVQFQLADPSSRFRSLQTEIKESLAKIPPQKREAVCEQLRQLLPLVADTRPFAPSGDAAGEGAAGSPATVGVDEAGSEEEPFESKSPSVITGNFQEIFNAMELDEAMAASDQTAKNNLLKLTKLFYQFTLKSEAFMQGILTTLDGGRGGDSLLCMRGWTLGIGVMIKKLIQEGDLKVIEDIEKYLNDMNSWQAALVSAYQESFNEYVKSLWKRLSPKAIEREAPSRGMKILGKDKGAFWEIYEEKAQDLSPDLAKDEYRRILDNLTNEIFKNL